MGRILALDYGTKRIGAAITDELQILSQPLDAFLENRKDELIDFIKQREVELVLLGLPTNLSSQDTKSTELVREFAEWLKKTANVPIKFLDERYTTVEAEKQLASSGFSATQSRRLVDSLVAQKLLLRYLERKHDVIQSNS